MKKFLIILLAFLTVASTSEARKVKGKVTGEGKALSGVIVTDGKNFTQTNSRGKYSLEVDPAANFVYLVTPSGFVADYSSGTTEFYQKLTESSKYNFDLKATSPSSDYTLFSISDPQMKSVQGGYDHFEKFSAEPLKDLIEQAAKYSKERNTVAICLGDLGWNLTEVFPDYKAAMSQLGIPVYNVIGNHDFIQDKEGEEASEAYREAFGPVNYAFFLGNDLVVGLEDIIFTGNGIGDPSKSGKYKEGYKDSTLDWLEGLLSYIPSGTHIFIGQHSPLYHWWTDKYIVNADRMLEVVKDYDVDFLSGHTHIQNNFTYSDNIHEHNAASLCGAWWDTKICNDGTPRGYEIFNNVGNYLTWFWHNVDYPEDYQVEFIDLGQSPRYPNALVANVWDYDEGWTVEWYQDGALMGELAPVADVSPTYIKEINAVFAPRKKSVSQYKKPRLNIHYFAAIPSQYAKTVGIKVTNPLGREWEYTFNMSDYVDVQPHRGGAGVMPENTFSAMQHAIELGVNTLEMDMQITADGKVIISHENYFHPDYCTRPDGSEIKKKDPREYIYTMPYDSVAKYETGLKENPRFPEQKKIREHKPLASALIDFIESYTAEIGVSPMRYNIEVKTSAKEGEGVKWPEYHDFVDTAIPLLLSKNLGDRLVVQCFDERALEYMHEQYPDLFLSYLTEKETDLEELLSRLSFVPDWWSPNYAGVTEENVKLAHEKGIKVVPWTVDDPQEIERMIKCDVDAIISNYPERVLNLTRGYGATTYAKE